MSASPGRAWRRAACSLSSPISMPAIAPACGSRSLDDRMLDDIGVTRADIDGELRRPLV